MLKTLIIATVLLPRPTIAQQSQQLPQSRQPGQWCPVGWMTSGNYCVPGSDKAPAAIPKNGWCPAGWRVATRYDFWSSRQPAVESTAALAGSAINRWPSSPIFDSL